MVAINTEKLPISGWLVSRDVATLFRASGFVNLSHPRKKIERRKPKGGRLFSRDVATLFRASGLFSLSHP